MDSLVTGFVASCREYPDRPALEVAGERLTYGDLMRQAATLASAVDASEPPGGPPLTAVFGRRSVTAYAGMLAALLRGHGYVPLNTMFPPDRTRAMLVRSECHAVIADAQATEQLPEVIEEVDRKLLFVVPRKADADELGARFGEHEFLAAEDLAPVERLEPPTVGEDALAYLLFTSGSTGVPKGVAVAHRNVHAFLDFVVEHFDVRPEDRFSQISEMTFDVSVCDMFAAWERGACVCVPSPTELLRLDRFIVDSSISFWFSVPSAAIVMRRMGALKEGRFPTLRVTLFAGEPLPGEIASAWAKAAPNSVLENFYGPTELTIDCTRYLWTDESDQDVHLGIVPIGVPFPDMDVLVVDDELRPVAPGEPGELLMTGPLMTIGYWNDPERTAQAYVVPPGETRRFYRTGDRVDQTPDGLLRYLGRIDHQIKVRGHRVELGEVEGAVRDESGLQAIVAVGWPKNESSASGIEVFAEGPEDVDVDGILERLRSRLPYYMIPGHIHVMDELPLNANGKFDRNALVERLEAVASDHHR